MVSIIADGQQVVRLESLLKEGVEHILSSEADLYGTSVCGGEKVVTLAEVVRGIGDVLHDVRGKPDLLHPEALVLLKDAEALVNGADTIVHPR